MCPLQTQEKGLRPEAAMQQLCSSLPRVRIRRAAILLYQRQCYYRGGHLPDPLSLWACCRHGPAAVFVEDRSPAPD